MKNYKKFLGSPKMCSNYTSKLQNQIIVKNRPHKEIISSFSQFLTNEFSPQFHNTPSKFSQEYTLQLSKKILHLLEMCSNYTTLIRNL